LNTLFNFDSEINDIGIKRLTNLTYLYHISRDNLTDSGLGQLINLRTLIIPFSNKVTDSGLKKLTNLTYLAISHISYEAIKPLTKLVKLSIRKGKLTDDNIRNLTHLIELSIESTDISDEGIKVLTNLKKLSLIYNGEITNTLITNIGLQELTGLISLDLKNLPTITDEGIKRLTKLSKLSILNSQITNRGLLYLSSLTALEVNYHEPCNLINDDSIQYLTSLMSLTLIPNLITEISMKKLTNLTSLQFQPNWNNEQCQMNPDIILNLKVRNKLTYFRDLGNRFKNGQKIITIDVNRFDWINHDQLDIYDSTNELSKYNRKIIDYFLKKNKSSCEIK
jgi:hypothetical protein